MSWMSRWASPFPLYLERAAGAEVVDVDGHAYADSYPHSFSLAYAGSALRAFL